MSFVDDFDLVRTYSERFNAAREKIMYPNGRETVDALHAQAFAYLWGWRDAGGVVTRTDRADAFPYAYGLIAALHEIDNKARPSIQDAWKAFNEFGWIRDPATGYAVDRD